MYRNIVVCTDFSEDSKQALRVAISMAKTFGAHLYVLHVAHDESQLSVFLSDKEFKEIRERILDDVHKNFEMLEREFPDLKALSYTRVIRQGVPHAEIVMEVKENAQKYDLVVIGAHGTTALKDLFHYGSTAEKVVRKSPIDVLVVRIK